MKATMTVRFLQGLALIALIAVQGTLSLRCFVCETTSAQSYADANDQCNIHNQQECADSRATACMLEGYMKPNNVAQVVKKCVPKCPVFINTTAEVVRCCPKDGCNGELNHRPPPHMDMNMMRGRFPPYGGPPNMDRDEGGMERDTERDMGRDMGPGPGQGPGPMGAGPRPDQHPPRPDLGGDPKMPPPEMPEAEAPMIPEDNAVDPKDRQMKRPRKGMEKLPKGPETRKKSGPVSRSGTTDGQMGDNSSSAIVFPSFVCIICGYIVSSMNW